MIYWDTSVIIKLYIKETDSEIVAKKAQEFDLSIPFTLLHELEITNALELKRFRNELTPGQIDKIKALRHYHEENFIYHRPIIDWSSVYQQAIHLSQSFSYQIGTRSLDILHVAAACILNAGSFFSNDSRQLSLAESAGFKPIAPGHR